AAAAPRGVINRGLAHPIRGADEIRLLGANREREALLPVRFGGIPEDRSWVGVPGKVVGAGNHCGIRAGGQTADGPQELSALKSLRVKGCHGASLFGEIAVESSSFGVRKQFARTRLAHLR